MTTPNLTDAERAARRDLLLRVPALQSDLGRYLLDAYAEAIRAECDAEIAALKADGERLDWLERTIREMSDPAGVTLGWEDEGHEQFRLYRQMNDEFGTWQVLTNESCEDGTGLRDAIDAVRAAQPRGTE